jgi:Trpc4-associated protein
MLVDLLNVVTLQDINQENICCLNTALVFFIIEDDPATLLDQITDESVSFVQCVGSSCTLDLEPSSYQRVFCVPPRPQARGNFRELLQFWQAYYARKDRDRISLAFSSDLPFTVWQEAVDRLQRTLAEC